MMDDTPRCFGKSAQMIDGKEDARYFREETCKKSAQLIENNGCVDNIECRRNGKAKGGVRDRAGRAGGVREST